MAAPPAQGVNNLVTLIKRLEAATSRLEDLASSSGPDTPRSPGIVPTGGVNSIVSSPGAHHEQAAPLSDGLSPAQPPVPTLPPSIIAMDEILETELKNFIAASESIDTLVNEQAFLVAKAFADQRRFILIATKAIQPNPSVAKPWETLCGELQPDMDNVGKVRDGNRGSPMKEHLGMVAEGIGALTWLLPFVGPPADYVGEVIGGAQMYGNRVLKKYKETEPKHVQYVQAYYALLKALQAYIKKHHPKGLVWNDKGIDALQAYQETASIPSQSNGVPSAPPSSGGPPPPPPPPLPTFDNIPAPPPPPPGSAPKVASGGDMGAVFDQLNRGEAVTSGLKKVDKSQMTHKNPSLRAGSTVPDARSKSPGPNIKPKPASMRQNSTPPTVTSKAAGKKELDGNKWIIENWDAPSQPLTIEVQLTQSLLISNCKNTTIILQGKANAISIDNCPRLQILVENLVSSIDVIKSPNFAVQVTGALPTILLDQVDGASLYLGKDSLNCEVFTSKCSSVNIVLPPADEDHGDSVECPLPEQLRSYIKDGKVVSEIVEHAG